MNIGSTFAISGKFEVEALSTVVFQPSPVTARSYEEVDQNVDMVLEWMEKAASGYPGYDLFIAPEFVFQGIGPYYLNVLLDLDGPEIGRVKAKCAELDVWGIFHAVLREHQGKKICNVAFMINNEGEVVHTYRKMNPYVPTDGTCPGTSCPVTPGPKGSKIGIITCADGDYPEAWREAAYNGANIIVRVTHYPSPWDKAWEITNKAGAYCNQVYVVGAGCVDINYGSCNIGRSMILNPDGTIITEAPAGIPWLIKADLYPQIIDHMHKEMVMNNFLWSFDKRGASYPEEAGVGRPLSDYNAYRQAREKREQP